ncbi:hypothetical protein M2271_002458 [Streptomyces sp. LBL]|nr:hypothetical protein [Streptomyces sp. LBL]
MPGLLLVVRRAGHRRPARAEELPTLAPRPEREKSGIEALSRTCSTYG